METTDRLGLLLGQLDHARKIAEARLEGMVSPASLPHGAPITARQGGGRLTDEEFLWEPAPGAWSIRRRGDQYPAPVTTIAWRLGHLHSDFAGRWEWTFGERRLAPDLVVDFTPSAEEALERFWALMDRWRASVAAMTPEQLDTVGFGQYPWGSDPEEPFIDVILDSNFEFIHHMAEIALLRDLWQAHAPNQVMGA